MREYEGGERRMFVLYADKTRLDVRHREPVASGSENVYQLARKNDLCYIMKQ